MPVDNLKSNFVLPISGIIDSHTYIHYTISVMFSISDKSCYFTVTTIRLCVKKKSIFAKTFVRQGENCNFTLDFQTNAE